MSVEVFKITHDIICLRSLLNSHSLLFGFYNLYPEVHVIKYKLLI